MTEGNLGQNTEQAVASLRKESATKESSSLLIPASSLVVKPEGLFVALVRDGGTVHFQRVNLGRDYGKEMEVTTGVKDGQTILVEPDIDLKEGASVRTVLMKSPRV